jgi:hypothetical protein
MYGDWLANLRTAGQGLGVMTFRGEGLEAEMTVVALGGGGTKEQDRKRMLQDEADELV